MTSVGARISVSGAVQGVGYRYFCYKKAADYGLVGWIRNEPDGTVMVAVEGDRGLVESLIQDLKLGPASAVVKDVGVDWRPFTGQFTKFDISMYYSS